MIDVVLMAFVFALGACVGSFLNVVIYRMPRGESIVFPPSHCPHCGRGIRWYDNIPILSWLILRGRCRFCRAPISPQYILVEFATGAMVAALYVCYFVLRVRGLAHGPSQSVRDEDMDFLNAWPMFLAHAALVCGLVACSVVDIRHWLVPLPVMWTVAVIGAVAAAFRPHPFLPTASPEHAAMAVAAGAGLILSLLAIKWGLLTPSFIDADGHPARGEQPSPEAKPAPVAKADSKSSTGKRSRKARRKKLSHRSRGSVAITTAEGVNPRIEILRECLFLAPALTLAAGAWAVLHWAPAVQAWWACWFDPHHHPLLGPRLAGVGGAIFGFLIGGAWVWATRILGTLAFGKEAMGLGDVHILAGVGAVTGWAVPSLAFFAAPVAGLLVALYRLARGQRELPYGPWLAIGTVFVMLFYDRIVEYLAPGLTAMFQAF